MTSGVIKNRKLAIAAALIVGVIAASSFGILAALRKCTGCPQDKSMPQQPQSQTQPDQS